MDDGTGGGGDGVWESNSKIVAVDEVEALGGGGWSSGTCKEQMIWIQIIILKIFQGQLRQLV